MSYLEKNQRTQLSTIVPSQLPEFVRSEYPTFVAFVEAYYEYLDNQQVDLFKVRDIDETLVDFIKYFKAELAHNYPISSSSEQERFLLKNIKDQYLAKGSEASYKLLFRLLYGKDVYMAYPGQQMLRISDGRWQQDTSIFVSVEIGDPEILVGQTITVESSSKITRPVGEAVLTTAPTINLEVNVEKVAKFSDNVWEIFLDRNFYGRINLGDTVKYKSYFQGNVLPVTSRVKVQNSGTGFKPGQVFQLSSGEGTPFWLKVISVNDNGSGLKNIDIIKFGLNYSTDFSVTVLPTSAVTNRTKVAATTTAAITYSTIPGRITSITVTDGGSGYTIPPIVSIESSEVSARGATATAHLDEFGSVSYIEITSPGSNYVSGKTTIVITAASGDNTGGGAQAELTIGTESDYIFNDNTSGFSESGFVNEGDYLDATERGRSAEISFIMSATGALVGAAGSGYVVGDEVTANGATFKVESVSVVGGITSFSVVDGHSYNKNSFPVFSTTGYLVTGGSGSNGKVFPTYSIVTAVIDNGGFNYDVPYPVIDIQEPLNYTSTAQVSGIDRVRAKVVLDISKEYDPDTGEVTRDYISDATVLGSIESASVLTSGSGYTERPPITFVPPLRINPLIKEDDIRYPEYIPGRGNYASGLGIISGGQLIGVQLTNYGYGYEELPQVIVGREWVYNKFAVEGQQYFYGNNLYTVVQSGTFSATPPTHQVLTINAGSFVNNRTYTISSLGDTDWNLVVGNDPEGPQQTFHVGDVIIARYAGTGTGQATTPIATNGTTWLEYSGTPATAEVDSLFYGGKGFQKYPTNVISGAYGYCDGAYVGSVARQFFVDAKDTAAGNPALLNVSLDSTAKYPGYYKTNDGFLNDSMYIQDSYYYQAFSYVIKIDQQLNTYASVVRSMLHPAGMQLFGEYSINNEISTSVSLTALVKSLGVTLYDELFILDDASPKVAFGKDLSTDTNQLLSVIQKIDTNLKSVINYTDLGTTTISFSTGSLTVTGSSSLSSLKAGDELYATGVSYKYFNNQWVQDTDGYVYDQPIGKVASVNGNTVTLYTFPPFSVTNATGRYARYDYVTMTETITGKTQSKKIGFQTPVTDETTNLDAQTVSLTEPYLVSYGQAVLLDITVAATDNYNTAVNNRFEEVFTKSVSLVIDNAYGVATMTEPYLTQYGQSALLNFGLNILTESFNAPTGAGYVVLDAWEQGGYFEGEYVNGWASTIND